MRKNSNMVSVDIDRLSTGLTMTFKGVSMVFESLGSEKRPVFRGMEEDGAMEPELPATLEEQQAVETTEEVNTLEAKEEAKGSETVKEQEAAKGSGENADEPEMLSKPGQQEEKASASASLTRDDLVRIAATKIRQDKKNSDRIGALVKTYGVSTLKELPEEKFEAFMTDLSEL